MTHAECYRKARVATPCTASTITFGGRCLNCGYEPTKDDGQNGQENLRSITK